MFHRIAIWRVFVRLDFSTFSNEIGQEDQFPPPRLSACYVIREKTFAGTHGNGRDAPITDVRRGGFPLASSTDL
jgi:hypothetical protein